jgi:hypothetical protein
MVTVISVTQILLTTFHVAFSQACTLTTAGVSDPNMLIWSASAGEWSTCTVHSQLNSTTFVVFEDNGDPDGSLYVLLAQPAELTSTELFQVASPIIAA